MRTWLRGSLVSLSIAVACAHATDEELIRSGDDDSGGSSGSGASPFGGTAGFGGTPSSGGASGRGGTTTGGATATGGAVTGGVAGKGGTGGTDSGGASDGGEGGTDACSPPVTVPDLRIDYESSTRPVAEDPEGEFDLVNETGATIPLSELSMRYWFHSEFTCDETTNRMAVNVVVFQLFDPFMQMDIPDVTKRVVGLDTGAPGCDAYFELGFSAAAGSLARGQSAIVKYFAQIPIYEASRPKNQANDYSWGGCTTAPVYFERVTLYRNGRLVSGREPGGGGAGGEGGASGGMGGI